MMSAKLTPAALTSMRTWPGPHRGLGALLDLEHVGGAVPCDDDRAHGANPTRRRAVVRFEDAGRRDLGRRRKNSGWPW